VYKFFRESVCHVYIMVFLFALRTECIRRAFDVVVEERKRTNANREITHVYTTETCEGGQYETLFSRERAHPGLLI
jgi:hypothetical protein